MRPLALLFAPMLAATACTLGGNVRTYPPATSPEGVQVQIGTSPRVAGELLAVDSTGLLVRTSANQLFRVPLAVARFVQPRHGSGVRVPPLEQDALRRLRNLTLMSRFPQGVSNELLHNLLRAYGQDSVVVVR
jgi:hypothetical protein